MHLLLELRWLIQELKIKLAWSSMKHVDYEKLFKEEGIDIISAQEMITPEAHDRKFGLYKVEEDGTKTGLAMSAYNWGRFYKKIIEGIEDGLYKSADGKDNKAINYFGGDFPGVIDLICWLAAALLPTGHRRYGRNGKAAYDLYAGDPEVQGQKRL